MAESRRDEVLIGPLEKCEEFLMRNVSCGRNAKRDTSMLFPPHFHWLSKKGCICRFELGLFEIHIRHAPPAPFCTGGVKHGIRTFYLNFFLLNSRSRSQVSLSLPIPTQPSSRDFFPPTDWYTHRSRCRILSLRFVSCFVSVWNLSVWNFKDSNAFVEKNNCE